MQRFRWVALQGSARGLLSPLLLLLAVHITTSGIPALAADDQAACPAPFARIVSIQGSVEVLRAGQSTARQNGAGQIGASRSGWIKVTRLDTPLCEGDRLRTGALSRAALFIQPETLVRVDQHTRISLSQTAEETLVEFIQEGVLPASATPNACGAGYFITRFPRKFKVNTPHLNAAVEGTEFLVAMRCETTELSVFEGKVLAASAGTDVFPPQTITSGQTLTIGGAEPPAIKLLVKPADAVQWVLYYPPLSDARAEAELPTADQCRSLPKPLDQTCLSQRAELLMRLGQIDQAQREIDEAVAMDSQAGEANALRAVILIARNDKAGALEAAKSATAAAPNAYRTWLALSYAQQAAFKLEDALESAKKAQSLEPSSSLTNARVAELLMSLGRIKEAERAAQAAVDANPAESRARTVLGFVRLAQIKTKAARKDFQAAIERDSSDPLPRLGLGLAIIREGNLVAGREQLEIAVALDPTNSLLRSYVGKAYYEENRRERNALAVTQFGLAKQLDPQDPTPWFYESILQQSRNRPVDALHSTNEAITRNDRRAVHRSRLLLDEDRAARTADLARTYESLGLSQPALAESAKALAADPTSYSAHRLLADTYALRPRQEITRASELLQAQLYQPLGSAPLQPQLANDTLLTFQGARLPGRGLNELDPLLEQDGLHLRAYGVIAEDDTKGDQEILSGLAGPLSFSASRFRFETEGFRANNDRLETLDDVFVQARLGDRLSAQFEATRVRQTSGDIRYAFDPTPDTFARFYTEQEIYRAGFRVQTTPNSQLLLSIYHSQRYDDLSAPGFPAILTQLGEGDKTEAQYTFAIGEFRGLFGMSYFDADKTDGGLVIGTPIAFRPIHFNTYGYTYVPVPTLNLWLQAGVSYDRLRSQETGDLHNTNPKFGLIWAPTPSTTLRLARTTSLRRQFMTDQSLEPTQVAGFAQYHDDREGAIARLTALSADHVANNRVFFGAALAKRDISSPLIIDLATNQRSYDPWKEREGTIYAAWAATAALLFGAEARWERFERPFRSDFLGFITVETWYAPLSVRMFPREDFSLSVVSTYVDQDGRFFDVTQTQFDGHESFWVTDAAIDYRLPRRSGALTVGVRNAFDERFLFQSTEFGSTRVAMTRQVFARLSIGF